MRKRYIFLRVLEACNANCFMCGFALSKDGFRLGTDAMTALMEDAKPRGFGYIRFTGGEPLMHANIEALIKVANQFEMKTSLITNGALLERKLPRLREAGLNQIVVSLDGQSGETHDVYRRTPGLFDKATSGLKAAVDGGLHCRVNTVVGPHNYAELPSLQRTLVDLGVQQWEVSALKLKRGVPPYEDLQDVERVGETLYGERSQLVPLGKRWYGDTAAERAQYFQHGLPPRASAPVCHVTDDVVFLDTKTSLAWPCSALSWRSEGVSLLHENRYELDNEAFKLNATYYRENGPSVCDGCTATAAGYSDWVAASGDADEWRY